jgi:hypothetical protein
MPNEIAPNSAVTPGFDVFVPIDAVWKYDQGGSFPGVSWNELFYDDRTWPEGLALLYNESAALPAPKNTQLSLVSTSGNSIVTYYFRHHFFSPASVTNITASFRHVVDDGAIFYLNGAEFHRFNLPPGGVLYESWASPIVGDGVFNDFQIILTNLVAGKNVIATEVHQGGGFADVSFGAELSIHVDSTVSEGIAAPALRIHRFQGNTVLSWTSAGFTLESSETLGPGADWQPVEKQSNPYFASPSASAQRFYRLGQ